MTETTTDTTSAETSDAPTEATDAKTSDSGPMGIQMRHRDSLSYPSWKMTKR